MRDAVFDDNAKEVSAQYAQDTADDSTDEPLEAYHAQACFKPHHGQADPYSSASRNPRGKIGQSERSQVVTGNRNYKNENKTNNNQVHKDPPDRGCFWSR
jgi:hypothetical protein